MQNNLCTLLFLLLTTCSLRAQHFIGYNSSNYSGINGIYSNPANIVDSRYVVDLNLLSGDLTLNNSYLGLSTDLFKISNSPFADSSYNGDFQRFRNDFFKENTDRTANIFQSYQLQGPSVSVNFGKNAIALTSGLRQYFFVDNLDPSMADFILYELEDPTKWNTDINNQKFNAQMAAWAEFGVAYGREIWSNGEHYVKGALHLKANLAIASAYFYADELMLNFRNNDSMTIRTSDIRFGYSSIVTDSIQSNIPTSPSNLLNKFSMSADIGFVYEWRPKHEEFAHPTKDGKLVRHKNKYKLKAGLAITDIGQLRFDRGAYAGSFGGVSSTWDLNQVTKDMQGIETFAKTMQDSLNMDTNRDGYALRLPTALNLQVDYNIWKGFYANFSAHIAFSQNDAPLKLHNINSWVLTPRFEHAWFDLGLPLMIDGFNNLHAGLNVRLGPIFMGSSNIFNYAFGSHVKGFNFYGGMKIPIPYGKPRKKKEPKPLPELTTTEEPKDSLAVETPNLVESDPMNVDNDRENLNEIEATEEPVEEPVVEEPADSLELEKPNLVESDPMNVDNDRENLNEIEATEEPVVEEPVEEPVVEEPVEEPVDPAYYEVKENETVFTEKQAFFNTGTYNLNRAQKELLKDIAKDINADPTIKVIIHGHTDNIGSKAANEKLSKQRAESVKDYLITQGVKSNRMEITSHGYTDPDADNSTEEGRRKNRRVEILLLKVKK